jgi:pantothenate synthetase
MFIAVPMVDTLLDVLQMVDAADLQSVAGVDKQPALLAVAAKYGSVRLIDNIVLEPKHHHEKN